MTQRSFRKWLYFSLVGLRGQALSTYYYHFLHEDQTGIPANTSEDLLRQMLRHCSQSVPYYSNIMQELGEPFFVDPVEYLRRMPILTKDVIRRQFEELKSSDLNRRKWDFNTTGGSTGAPVRLIQDWEYAARSGAITLLYSHFAGREIGEYEVHLWGSERDIVAGRDKWESRLVNKLTNTTIINAFRMTPDTMRRTILLLNTRRPKLIVAYVEAIYELARFVEREGLEVVPQTAIMTSAGTLFPFMRETIEAVFKCRVFNRYGSRELGDIACERPGYEGLWIAPWGNYVEVVDHEGNRVPSGTEGEILVTSLTNFAMPLVRYQIGDRGMLVYSTKDAHGRNEQLLGNVVGRTSDMIITSKGDIVHGGYFMVLLFHREWILQYQVIQKSTFLLVFRIVRMDSDCHQSELDDIAEQARIVMGRDCTIEFEFVNEIIPSPSGKYRYVISEIQ